MKCLPCASIFLTAMAAATPLKHHILLNHVRDMLLVPNTYGGSRELQTSDGCIAATEAKQDNPIYDSFFLNVTDACPEAMTSTNTSVTVDYSDCPSYIDGIKEACDAVNGKTVPVDKLFIDCMILGESLSITINLVYDCLDASCDAKKYNENVAKLEMQEFVDFLGAECTYSGAYHAELRAGIATFVIAISTALFV